MELLEPVFLMNDQTLQSVKMEGKRFIECKIEGEIYYFTLNAEKEVSALSMSGYMFYSHTIEEYQKELNEKVQWLYTQSKHRVKLLF